MPRLQTLKPRVATLGAPTRVNGSGWSKEGRGDRHQRGYGTAWERTRKRILERDNYICQQGLREGFIHTGNIVDHVVPKSQGGTDDESNLAVICARHHKLKTQQESKQARGG